MGMMMILTTPKLEMSRFSWKKNLLLNCYNSGPRQKANTKLLETFENLKKVTLQKIWNSICMWHWGQFNFRHSPWILKASVCLKLFQWSIQVSELLAFLFKKSICDDTSKTRSQSKLLVAGCKFKIPIISQPTTTSISWSKAGRKRKTKHRFVCLFVSFSLFSREGVRRVVDLQFKEFFFTNLHTLTFLGSIKQ
jgi:hypothetical protein